MTTAFKSTSCNFYILSTEPIFGNTAQHACLYLEQGHFSLMFIVLLASKCMDLYCVPWDRTELRTEFKENFELSFYKGPTFVNFT